ncbi:MAG: hypothetical protein K2X87_13285 [Gemmataceae bacterium]|nr:hypothetical protein [Gemmataceae bacterium]
MPITLSLTGRPADAGRLTRRAAHEWLAKAAVWFESAGDAVLAADLARDAHSNPALLVTLHPASPPAELRLGGSGRVRVTAATTPAGPGYHLFLCDLLRAFAADFRLWWDPTAGHDPTGYFFDRDRAACDRHFLRWLAGACREKTPLFGLRPGDVTFSHSGLVLTPLGPRPREWPGRVAADPAAGRDFFPWWDPETDAAFYRNRALCRLWAEFPWRPPLTEAEGELTDQVAADLASAYKLDPAAELPWREWLEVLAAVENDRDGLTVTPADPELREAVARRAQEAAAGDPVGYRRHPLRVRLGGGWSVKVPGDFAREWGEDRTWTGWSGGRTVWFHAEGFTKPDGSVPGAAEAVAMARRSLPDGEPVAGLVADGLRGEAVWGGAEEDGRRAWRLSGVAAADGQVAVLHVYAEDPADQDWAVKTWRSLRHDP